MNDLHLHTVPPDTDPATGNEAPAAATSSASTLSRREQNLTDYYLNALMMLGRCAAEAHPGVGRGVHESLLRLRRRLAFHSEIELLDETHAAVESTMRDFGLRAKEMAEDRARESERLIQTVRQVDEMLRVRDRSYVELLREISYRLTTALSANDGEAAQRVADRLASCVSGFAEESRQMQAQLRQEIDAWRERQQSREPQSDIDESTGLPNRQEATRRMRSACQAGEAFCLVKFSVHEFSGLRDRAKGSGWEELIRLVAERVLEQVRPRDLVTRWNEHDLLVLLFDCPLPNAEARAAQIGRWLSGEYRVRVRSEWELAEVQVTAAATERYTGESSDQFVERADALSPAIAP
jgi:GGDEF domain-containing protein